MKKQLYSTACLSLLFAFFLSAGLTAQPGAALHFDGYDDRIQLQGLNLTGAFTIEAWVNPTEKSDFSTILSNKLGGYEMPGFSFAINNYASSDGKLVLETQLASTISSSSVIWGQWQHISITYDGFREVKMYINGDEIGTTLSDISLAPSPYPTVIGDYSVYFGNGKYSGTMDEVRIWNYARCDNAILAQMNCELIGNETGLIAYYNFNQGVAGADNSGVTTLNDLAGADNNGALENFALNGISSNWIDPGAVQTGSYCLPLSNSICNTCDDVDGDGVCDDVDNCTTVNPDQADADCDGVGNVCDVCPGGNDNVDANEDGMPDCKFPPASQSELTSAWKCGSDNKKVLICHQGATLCVSYAALADHLSHGDYIGPCGNASCIPELNFNQNQLVKSSFIANGLEIVTLPNPTTFEFELSARSDQTNHLFIRVTDIQGRTIYQNQGSPSESYRFGSEFARGIYFIEVRQGSERIISKLIKN